MTDGYDIQRLVVNYDDGGPQTQVLCDGDCAAGDFTYSGTLSLPDSVEQIEIVAENALCSNNVFVDTNPSQVNLSCGPDQTIYVGGASVVTYSEVLDAICPESNPGCENYTISGGCPTPSVSTLPTSFPVSSTPLTVTHSAAEESCSWQLHFDQGNVDQLAYIERGEGSAPVDRLVVRHINGDPVFQKEFQGRHEPYLLALDSTGTRMAVGGTINDHPVHLIHTNQNEFDVPANYPVQIEFQPNGQHLAILDFEPGGNKYRLRILNLNLPGRPAIGGTLLSSTTTPRFDWSADGSRIVFALIYNLPGPSNEPSIGAIQLNQIMDIPLVIPVSINSPIVLPVLTTSYTGPIPMESADSKILDVSYVTLTGVSRALMATTEGIYSYDLDLDLGNASISHIIDDRFSAADFSMIDDGTAALNVESESSSEHLLGLFSDLGWHLDVTIGENDPVTISLLQDKIAVTKSDAIDIYSFHWFTEAEPPGANLELITTLPANSPKSVRFSPARQE